MTRRSCWQQSKNRKAHATQVDIRRRSSTQPPYVCTTVTRDSVIIKEAELKKLGGADSVALSAWLASYDTAELAKMKYLVARLVLDSSLKVCKFSSLYGVWIFRTIHEDKVLAGTRRGEEVRVGCGSSFHASLDKRTGRWSILK